jgi:hypothetical protein
MSPINPTTTSPGEAAARALELLNEIVAESAKRRKRRAVKICKTPLAPKKLFSDA